MLFTFTRRCSALAGSQFRAIIHPKTMSSSAAPSNNSLTDVVNKLNAFAPLSLAESWDNVGLLLEPSTPIPIQRILLTNDLTERVMDEALARNSNLIISYHPPIFSSLKRITQSTWKQRIVAQCLENRIALYSPHTAWDAVGGGVNDWLASFLVGATSRPITPSADAPDAVGAGRLLQLGQPLSLGAMVDAFKQHINIAHVNVAIGDSHSLDSSIRTVAVCAGSGSSVLRGAKADVYITGEMSHHDVLDAVHQNTSVILCNHSNSERGFLERFRTAFGAIVGEGIVIEVAARDADPLKVL